MLNFLGRRVKCISWYFSGANVAPCVRAQAMHFSFALSRIRQFASVDLLNVVMLVSSTKPIAVVAPTLSCGRRVEAKKRKRIGDRVEPCGMPDVVDRTLSSYVPSMRQQLLGSCISKQVRRTPMSTGPCLGFQPIPCRLPLVEAQAKPHPAQVTRCLLLKHTSPASRPDERSCLFVYRHAHPFSRAT